MTTTGYLTRPCDMARLLLSSGDALPRRRARDQQADRAGLQLKQRLLEELVRRDPDANQLEACLLLIVEEWGPPYGPAQAVARLLRDEWQLASQSPPLVSYWSDETLRPRGEETRVGRQLPG